jgi:hypothetical protein
MRIIVLAILLFLTAATAIACPYHSASSEHQQTSTTAAPTDQSGG